MCYRTMIYSDLIYTLNCAFAQHVFPYGSGSKVTIMNPV